MKGGAKWAAVATVLLVVALSGLHVSDAAAFDVTRTATSPAVSPRAPVVLTSSSPAQGLVVPTPGSCAPSDSQNPLSQYLGNVVNHIPVIGNVTQVVGLVGTVLGTMVSWVSDPNQGAQAVGSWALWNITGYNPEQPACYRTTSPYGFFSSVFLGNVQLGAESVFSDAYNALADASIVLVLFAGALRLVRGMSDREVRGEHLILDTVVRVVVGVGAIYVSFAVLAWLLPLASAFGVWLFGQLLSVAGAPAVRDPLGVLLFTSAAPILRLGLMGLIVLPFAIWFLLRMVGLLIIRFLVICFGVMFLPLLIAVAVYDPRSKVVRWWAEALASAAIIPVVTSALLGGTLGLALRFGEGSPSDGMFSTALVAEVVVALGGMWLCGRVVRALLFHDIAGGGHPFDPIRNFVGRAVGMAVLLPAAAGGLLAGPLGGAAGAASGGGAGGLAAVLGQRARAKQSPGGAGGSTGGGVPGSPAEVLGLFSGSAAGAEVAEAATPDLPAETMPAGRWAALAADPQLGGAMDRLKTAVLAHVTRTGQMGVAPEEREHFVRAAWTARAPAAQEAA